MYISYCLMWKHFILTKNSLAWSGGIGHRDATHHALVTEEWKVLQLIFIRIKGYYFQRVSDISRYKFLNTWGAEI